MSIKELLNEVTVIELTAYGDFDMLHTEAIFIGPKTETSTLFERLTAAVPSKVKAVEGCGFAIGLETNDSEAALTCAEQVLKKAGFVKVSPTEIRVHD